MSLSASSLFHFTKEKSSLLGILESNFKVRHCKETIVFKEKPNNVYVPMVSFCDIPLSQIKEHISKYGSYGLGLTKDWGIRNKLNPVLYLSKGSNVAASYIESLKHFVEGGKADLSNFTTEQKLLLDLVRYIKNYEGTLSRKENSTENYRYSDEREWRYVPPIDYDCQMLALEKFYNNEEYRSKLEVQVADLRLHFEPNDIKYVIIKSDNEISEIVNHLKRAKGKKYSYDDVERLTTRILTCDQIMSDI